MLILGVLVCLAGETYAVAAAPCCIEVVEKGSGWPVPLVQLRTTHHLLFVTDNAGVVAIDEPELIGREVFFHVEGHGYEVPSDGFGMRGVRLTPQPGKTLRIEVTRTMIARRLGRLTGAGLFAHSQKLGRESEWRESGTVGCDSVQTAVHRGRHYWLWGDSSLYHYPLGIFHASCATTALMPLASYTPPLRVRFEYFKDDRGKPRGVARMPGDGPTWLSGYVSLSDRSGEPRLVASYAKIKPPLEEYRWGLCVWDEKAEHFENLKVIWTKSDDMPQPPPLPQGHPVFWKDENGKPWVLFGNPLPTLRCPASFEAWQDPSQWQVIVPQKSLRSAGDGKPVEPHSGSIAWNPWRKRWVTVFMQRFGKPSAFGELWYAEAAAPTGPWGSAVKVLSHNNYTFYNPRIHPKFSPQDSPILLFEGTYTGQFADHPQPTPRYDYNQILYRLDLDDERLKPALRD
jgi:hypothetical protein